LIGTVLELQDTNETFNFDSQVK